ncbi:hypothetical protein TNCV_176721 [Trichonephila clavipes]|nr:hypothetical protein TNCV_176721 [Trichonephila clavipes]
MATGSYLTQNHSRSQSSKNSNHGVTTQGSANTLRRLLEQKSLFTAQRHTKTYSFQWMTVYFWEPGLINSPQSHIMMSLMQDLTSLVFTVCGVTCRRLAVAMESGRRGLEMTTWS